jgi:DNA-binding MarR family transcriptional regulator
MRKEMLFKVVQTGGVIQRKIDAELEKAGLSLIRFRVMEILVEKDTGVMPSEIAVMTDKVRHDITGIILRMVRDGLVKTQRNESDARSTLVFMTKKGHEAYEKGARIVTRLADEMTDSVKETKIERLNELLGLIAGKVGK